MKKVLGIFRGFPGLGRVVAGVSLLETLRDNYGYKVKFISYLQGNKYLKTRGYVDLQEATSMDYCSIGLLPTNKIGVYIHNMIKEYGPDMIIIDGEPLILQSIKISHPKQKVVALLNPADIDNPYNDKEAMDFFNAMYSLCDLAIVHGLRIVNKDKRYDKFISTNTILRQEILAIKNIPTNNIYCILGGGTVNVGQQFEDSTIKIAKLCQKVAMLLPEYTMHIICSSPNIFNKMDKNDNPANVLLHKDIIPAERYYSDACLVITRSGRNTLSELAYLGIPAISFVSGCSYRKTEQFNNINDLQTQAIISASLEIAPIKFLELCRKRIGKKINGNILRCGNDEAVKYILQL